MKVAFVDLKQNYQSIKTEILNELNDVLDSTQYILGPKVEAFEKSFASAHQTEFCYGTSSGTDANHLALWALGIGPGDEVIIPANTFIATAWGATLCGATPVFVDCDEDSYTIDPIKIEEKITTRTKAIVAVHLYGQPANLDPIRELASKYNLYLVEDAAQAHLAEYKGRRVGGLGDISAFSFYPGKNLGAYGESGAVLTNSAALAREVKLRRDHGSEQKYLHKTLGHNYRMEGIQGAVLGVKLRYLDRWTEKRRSVASIYCEMLQDISEIKLPVEKSYAKHVYHLFVIQVDNRNLLQQQLSAASISTGLHYPIPLHLQACFGNLGYKEGDFPIAEALASRCLSLPMYPEMSEEEIFYVVNNVRKFFGAGDLNTGNTPGPSYVAHNQSMM
jgi:dTDP-4-amino-4,6-dideoxygalactose transaminase